jgi:uracil-DNA glycosylase family 4
MADRPSSRRGDDGLTLTGVRIAAAVRCAPPLNKPTIEERDNCAPFLAREIDILDEVRVIVALGQFGWNAVLRVLAQAGEPVPRPRPRFGHGAEVRIGRRILIGSFHPSQQNTFTGKLTAPMFTSVLAQARAAAAPG